MPRWLRWTGRFVAGLVLLIVLALAAVYVLSSLAIRKTYRFPDSAVRAATDSASLAWGRHLVEAVAKCQECHEGDLGGKMMIDDAAFARLATANLTAGRGGIAGYTDADFERAIRHGVGRDDRPLKAGDRVSTTLTFANMGTISVVFPVEVPGAPPPPKQPKTEPKAERR